MKFPVCPATALVWAFLLAFGVVLPAPASATEERSVNVCVYGATPSGILAAVAVKRGGKSVVIVEPGRWVGGILGAGIKPRQDCPNPAATGGMTRELIYTLGDTPAQIRESFQALLDENDIEVIFEHRVDTVSKEGARITGASFDLAPFDELGCPPAEPKAKGALAVKAGVFIDASYEGDLMAKAGIAYRVARESAEAVGEEIAGIREPVELTPVDPFVRPGRPDSGLLKWVTAQQIEPLGSASECIQAYNYRFYLTTDPGKRAPLTPPADYDAQDFELVGRYVEFLKIQHGQDKDALFERLSRIFPGWMNSGEYNYQRKSLVSIAPVGVSHLYADGDYPEKARVWKMHQDYLRGLHHFLSTDARVPEAFRARTAALGLDQTHHPDTRGWPHQLYVRLTRRLEGRYTLTTEDVYNRTTVDDPVALAQYGIDIYPCRRVWLEEDGQYFTGLEGWMFVGGARGPTQTPYPIPYRAITPKADQAENVLVSVCFSATHLGYASARMEPAFMICGEAAGIAACQALAEGVPVQDIDQAKYRAVLEASNFRLEWSESAATPGGLTPRQQAWVDQFFADADKDRNSRVSRAEWDRAKANWEWLFPIIDADKNGQIDREEYGILQSYKAAHPDWIDRLHSGEPLKK